MKYILLLNIFFLIVGCSEKEKYVLNSLKSNDSLLVINVDGNQEVMMKKYSDFFSCVHPIILDSTSQALIGPISKMDVVDSLLIVLDVGIAKSIFVFNRKGKFIRKIGSFGRGPGEYLGVCDFTFDAVHKNLLLLDTWQQKIHSYNLQTGEYKKSITLKGDDRRVRSYHICYKDSTVYADAYFDLPSPENYLLRVFSEDGVQQSKYMATGDYNKGWSNLYYVDKKAFYDLGEREGILFHQQFMDTIMMIRNKDVFPFAVVASKNFVTTKILKDINKNHGNDFPFNELSKKKAIWGISNIIMFKDYLYFRYLEGYHVLQILYQKTTGTTLKVRFTNDVLYTEQLEREVPQDYLCMDSKGLYTYITTENLPVFAAYAREGLFSFSPEHIDQISKLDEKSNPVILYYEFKQ